MFSEPTMDDFVARIEDHIQRSLDHTRRAVQGVERKLAATGQHRSGAAIKLIFRETLSEFERGVDGALQKLQHSAKTAKLDAREMRKVLGEHVGVYLVQMKALTQHEKLRQFSPGPGLDRLINEHLAKFDEILAFKLRQFDVGFSNQVETQMRDMVIVHGGGNNIITGDGNIGQQGTQNSQQTVNADDIAAKVDALEKALATVQLTNAQLAEIRGDIATIRAQLTKASPNASIVSEAAKSIRSVIEGVIGNALSNPLLLHAQALAQMVGLS